MRILIGKYFLARTGNILVLLQLLLRVWMVDSWDDGGHSDISYGKKPFIQVGGTGTGDSYGSIHGDTHSHGSTGSAHGTTGSDSYGTTGSDKQNGLGNVHTYIIGMGKLSDTPDPGKGHKGEISYSKRTKMEETKHSLNWVKLHGTTETKKKALEYDDIISHIYGFHIYGGHKLPGNRWTIERCKRICNEEPSCFAGDFNMWKKTCTLHSGKRACSAMKPIKANLHFKKIPCNRMVNTAIKTTPGARLALSYGNRRKAIEWSPPSNQKTGLLECLKHCTHIGCYGIDFDFATRKCRLFITSSLCGPYIPLTYADTTVNVMTCQEDNFDDSSSESHNYRKYHRPSRRRKHHSRHRSNPWLGKQDDIWRDRSSLSSDEYSHSSGSRSKYSSGSKNSDSKSKGYSNSKSSGSYSNGGGYGSFTVKSSGDGDRRGHDDVLRSKADGRNSNFGSSYGGSGGGINGGGKSSNSKKYKDSRSSKGSSHSHGGSSGSGYRHHYKSKSSERSSNKHVGGSGYKSGYRRHYNSGSRSSNSNSRSGYRHYYSSGSDSRFSNRQESEGGLRHYYKSKSDSKRHGSNSKSDDGYRQYYKSASVNRRSSKESYSSESYSREAYNDYDFDRHGGQRGFKDLSGSSYSRSKNSGDKSRYNTFYVSSEKSKSPTSQHHGPSLLSPFSETVTLEDPAGEQETPTSGTEADSETDAAADTDQKAKAVDNSQGDNSVSATTTTTTTESPPDNPTSTVQSDDDASPTIPR